jgi:tripartite ATP-independent transporter DctM subunit
MAVIIFFFTHLVILLFIGLPVVIAFLVSDILTTVVFMGVKGLPGFPLHIFRTLANFNLMPIPMFVFMGELLFHSAIIERILRALDRAMWWLPGRLSLVASVGGVIFGAMSGSTLANTAMLGSALVPAMEDRRYAKSMTIGPILGAGGLAMIIPPSNLGVLLASVASLSIAKVLMGGVIPGLILGAVYFLYILVRCALNPSLAPAPKSERPSMLEIVKGLAGEVLPTGIVIFSVIGLILLGFATPSEAAASGVAAVLMLIAFYRRLNWATLKKAIIATVEITGMLLVIVGVAAPYSALLAYTGAVQEVVNMVSTLELHPLVIVLVMQVFVLMLGTFMESIAIMMLTIPVFFPIINTLGLDPIWFAVLLLINVEIGQITPPFGMSLFVMKGVDRNVTAKELYLAALPFILIQIGVLGLLVAFPKFVLWLTEM